MFHVKHRFPQIINFKKCNKIIQIALSYIFEFTNSLSNMEFSKIYIKEKKVSYLSSITVPV